MDENQSKEGLISKFNTRRTIRKLRKMNFDSQMVVWESAHQAQTKQDFGQFLQESKILRKICFSHIQTLFYREAGKYDKCVDVVQSILVRMIKTSKAAEELITKANYVEANMLLRANLEKQLFIYNCYDKKDFSLFSKELPKKHQKESIWPTFNEIERNMKKVSIDGVETTFYSFLSKQAHPNRFESDLIVKELKDSDGEKYTYLTSLPSEPYNKKISQNMLITNCIILTSSIILVHSYFAQNNMLNTNKLEEKKSVWPPAYTKLVQLGDEDFVKIVRFNNYWGMKHRNEHN